MDHVSQVHFNDQLKDQYSPFDTHQIVQTLQFPSAQQFGLFLTVHLVNQNVLSQGLVLKDSNLPEHPYQLCHCGLNPILDSDEKPSDQQRFAEKCQFCEDKIENLYRCGQQEQEGKLGQNAPQKCDFKSCSRCFANYFLKIVQKHKLKNHAFWEPYFLEKKPSAYDETVEFFGGIKKVPRKTNRLIASATIAVIGAWQRNGKSPPVCLKQYQVTEPLFFQKSNDKSFLDLIFIHTGEKGELFFFQNSGDGVSVSVIKDNFEDSILDKKDSNHYPDLFDVPIRGKKVVLSKESQAVFIDPNCSYQTPVMKQPPKLAGDYLMFSSRVANDSSELSEFKNQLSTSIYNIRTGQEIVLLNAILVLQVKLEEGSPGFQELIYLARQISTYKLIRIVWEDLVKGQLEFSINQVSYSNPKPYEEWKVEKSEFEDLDEFYRGDQMLQGAIHSKSTRCTIISETKMHWVSYFLTHIEGEGVKTLKEIPDSQRQQEKPISFYHDKEKDKFLIIQGLQKVPETSQDKQYQKFDLLCIDQSQSQDDEQPGDEEEDNKQYFSTCKITSFLPMELMSSHELSNYSIRILSIVFDELGKVQLNSFVQVSLNQSLGSVDNTASRFVYMTNIVDRPLRSVMYTKNLSSSIVNMPTSHDQIEVSFGYIMPSQEHFIEYPIMAQTTYHPKRNQLLISNLTINKAKVLLSLDKFRFVSFVHSSLVDEDLEQSSQIYEESNNFHATRLDSGTIRIHILVCEERDPKRALRLMWFEVSTIDSFDPIKYVSAQNKPMDAISALLRQKLKTKSFQQLNYGLYKAKIDLPQVLAFEQIKKVIIFRAKKNQSQKLDICLVFQTVDRVFPYIIFDSQKNKKLQEKNQLATTIQTIGKIVPTMMVCGPDFSCFYVVGSKQGNQVLALYSETNNTEKIRIDTVVTQEEKIAKIQVRQDYKQKKTLRLVVLDMQGKVKEYELVKSHGIYTVGKSVKSQQIPKKQFQAFESLLKSQNWNDCILQESSLIAAKEDGQNFLYQRFSESQSWDILDKRNRREGERHSIAAKTIPWIEKLCFIVQIGTYSFVLVKPNIDSNRLDFTSRKINQQVKGIHTLRKKVVIELATNSPSSSLYVYYNSADMMLSYVNYHKNTQILSGPTSQGNYYASKNSNENMLGNLLDQQKALEQETDLYQYAKDGSWKKQFSYLHELDERMLDFLNYQTGQTGNAQVDYWCWKAISQTCGIARNSDDKSGPIISNDGTPTMVYFMCPTATSKLSVVRANENQKVLTFTEDETTVETRVFKIGVQQKIPLDFDPQTNYHSHDFEATNPKSNKLEQCVCYIIETSRQIKAKAIFTKNYLLWVTEKGRLYFAKLSDIDRNQRIFIQDVSNSGFPGELREDTASIKTLRRLLQPNTVSKTKCGIINLKQIVSSFQFQEFSLFVANDMDRQFVVRDEKNRQDVIQIQFSGVSTIWDIEECEEITYLFGADNQFDVKNFVRTGHLLRFTKMSTVGAPAELACFRPNFNQTLFVCQALAADGNPENLIYCFRLYCQRDIQEIYEIQRHIQDGLSLRSLNPNLFISNIMGRTFFDLFSKSHQVINQAYESLSHIDLDSVFDEENELEQKYDHIYLRKLYQTMLCPVAPSVTSIHIKLVSNLFRRISTKQYTQDEQSQSYQKSILQKALSDDPIIFNVLLKIMLLTREVRLSNLVTSLPNFQKLFQSQSQERNSFMEKATLQTNSTRKITGLETRDDAEIMCFGSNTTMLNEKQIRQRFAEEYECEDKEKELFEYKIVIMETEWLTDVGQFYIALRNADPLVFDNNVIKFLRNQLDFKNRIIWLMFVPYCIYMAMALYYYCVFITDEAQFKLGFFHGQLFSVVLRVLLALFTCYFLFVELIQLTRTGFKYFLDLKNYPYNIIYLLNVYIILEHSIENFVGLDQLRLAQVASIVTLLLWANLYYWMRLFPSTAMYVDMINQTIVDVKYFGVLVFIEICAFGNALMILNYIEARHQKYSPGSEEYQPVYQKAFGAPLIDAIISQYTLGLGNFQTDNFQNNPSVVLCWIYFLMATFFTQILFINMIIAMMGTTYDNVRENADRNALIMQTKILADFILFAPSSSKFQEMRYLYLAERVQEEVQSSFDIISTMKSINSNIREGFENSMEMVEEVKLQQAQIIDQLQTVQKDQQQHEKEMQAEKRVKQHEQDLVNLTQDLKEFLREQKQEAAQRERNYASLQTQVTKLKSELSRDVSNLQRDVSLLLKAIKIDNDQSKK